MTRFDLGSLVMKDDGTLDANGVLWGVTRLTGWGATDIAPITEGVTSHHGLYLLESRHGGRRLTLEGVTVAPTAATAWAAQAQLAGAVGLRTPTLLTVYETIPKSLSVVAGGAPLIDQNDSTTRFRWSLSLLALDPFKRGTARTVTVAAGASAAVTYVGTWPAAPTITTTAAGTVDVSIAATGTRVQAASVPSGTVIDCHEPGHTAYTGTLNQYGKLVQPVGWLRLAVGANIVVNSGTAPVTIDYFDTYL